MLDSDPSLYSTKTLHNLYIFDPFWWCTENFDCFTKISLEYKEDYMEKYQGKMFLNIEKVLVEISEK